MAVELNRELTECVDFMRKHKIHMLDNAQEWADRFRDEMLADPRVMDDVEITTEWFQYAMAAGYDIGYRDGLKDA